MISFTKQKLSLLKIESTSTRHVDGWAPIHVASSLGHESVIGVLLSQSAFVNFPTASTGQTPLYLASQNGHVTVVSQLLEHGADVELTSKDPPGWTAMHAACSRGHTAIVKLLKGRLQQAGAIDRQLTNDGQTALYLAAIGNHRDVVRELLSGSPGVDVSQSYQ